MAYISSAYYESTSNENPHTGTVTVPATTDTVLIFSQASSNSTTGDSFTIDGDSATLIQKMDDFGTKNKCVFRLDDVSTGAGLTWNSSWTGGAAGCEVYFVFLTADTTGGSTYAVEYGSGYAGDSGKAGESVRTPSATVTIGDLLVGFAVGYGATVNEDGDDTLIDNKDSAQVDYPSCAIYQEITSTSDVLEFKVDEWNNIECMLVAVKAPSAGGTDTDIDSAAGSVTTTGSSADLLANRATNSEGGAVAITGSDATLAIDSGIDAEAGSHTITGANADLTKDYVLGAESGGYTLTGADSDLTIPTSGEYDLIADSGSYAATGASSDVLIDRVIDTDSGAYTLTGVDADIVRELDLDADSGTYTATGVDATTDVAGTGEYNLDAESGGYGVTGGEINNHRNSSGGGASSSLYWRSWWAKPEYKEAIKKHKASPKAKKIIKEVAQVLPKEVSQRRLTQTQEISLRSRLLSAGVPFNDLYLSSLEDELVNQKITAQNLEEMPLMTIGHPHEQEAVAMLMMMLM